MNVKISPYLLPGFVILCFVVAFYPAINLLAHKWWTVDDYTHGMFVAPLLVFIGYQKRDVLTDKSSFSFLSIIILLLPAIIYLLALQVQIPTLIFLSFFLFILGSVYYLGGIAGIREFAIPLILLLILIPIPNQLLSIFTASLQLKISAISELLLRQMHIPLYREGNIINVQNMSFQVVQACSGIRSLISMTTMSILISYYTLKRLRSLIILFVLSIPVAILLNIARVFIMVLMFEKFQINLTLDTPHTIFGLVLFLVGVACLFFFQRVLEHWENQTNES